jgi:hypothetical protein
MLKIVKIKDLLGFHSSMDYFFLFSYLNSEHTMRWVSAILSFTTLTMNLNIHQRDTIYLKWAFCQ